MPLGPNHRLNWGMDATLSLDLYDLSKVNLIDWLGIFKEVICFESRPVDLILEIKRSLMYRYLNLNIENIVFCLPVEDFVKLILRIYE